MPSTGPVDATRVIAWTRWSDEERFTVVVADTPQEMRDGFGPRWLAARTRG